MCNVQIYSLQCNMQSNKIVVVVKQHVAEGRKWIPNHALFLFVEVEVEDAAGHTSHNVDARDRQ